MVKSSSSSPGLSRTYILTAGSSEFSPDSSLEGVKLTRVHMLTLPQCYTQSLKSANEVGFFFSGGVGGHCFVLVKTHLELLSSSHTMAV